MNERSSERKPARRVRAFASAHGGAEASVAHVGRGVTRIVLVGSDGVWGDVVTRTREEADAALREADVTVLEALDGEPALRMRSGPYEWRRMAGIQLGGPAQPRVAVEKAGTAEAVAEAEPVAKAEPVVKTEAAEKTETAEKAETVEAPEKTDGKTDEDGAEAEPDA